MDLTNEKWEVLEPLIPAPVRRADGRGRPWRNSRDVLNGILWVLRTGAPGATCQNATRLTRRVTERFQRWNEEDERFATRGHTRRGDACGKLRPRRTRAPSWRSRL